MADKKISQLTQGTPIETDVLPYVDITTGETKKALKSELQGIQGDAATVNVGTTTTLVPGSDATVVNSGDENDAILDFGIPEGEQGIQGAPGTPGGDGEDGTSATATAGTTTTLAPGLDATVTNVGTTNDAIFDFGIPRGADGDMQKATYDPNNLEKDIYQTSQEVYVDGATGSNTTGNGSANAPYQTIQYAIDSITDNAVDKKYNIKALPATYTENITLKSYVFLEGIGTIMSGTTGPLVTFTGSQSFIRDITFNLAPTTANQSIVYCNDATGFHELLYCAFNITTGSNNQSNIVNANAGTVTVSNSFGLYNQTGTSVTATEHNVYNQTGTGSIRILRTDIEVYIADENNNVNVIRDNSTGLFLSSKNTIYGQSLNASYSGIFNFIKSTANSLLNLTDGNTILLVGAGTGTGQVLELDSITNDATIDIGYSRIEVSSFATNRGIDVATGDTVNVLFNEIVVDDLYTGGGTVNIINADNAGNFIVNTDIKDLNTFLDGSTNQSLKDLFDIGFSAGWVSGGTITEPGTPDGTATVSAGTGLIRTSNDEQASIKMFDWDEATGLTFTTGVDNYVYVDYNSGSPIINVTTTLSDIQDNENDKFELYSVFKENATTLYITDHKQRAKNVSGRLQQYLLRKNHIERLDGLILGETGTRNITISEGDTAIKLNLTTLGPKDTSGTDTFDRYYACATTCVKTTGQTQWDNDQYDNAGTLTTIGSSKYSFQDFYIDNDNNLISVYAIDEYTSQALAENAGSPTPPDRIGLHGLYIGRITFQKLDTTSLSILSPFTGQAPGAVPVTDHGALSGLGDDDHTQYTLNAGRSGGQTIYGSTDSGEDLTIESTSNTTKGNIILKDKVGVGNNAPSNLNANANDLVIGNGTTVAGMTIYTGSGSYASLAFADGITGDEAYKGMVRYNHPLDQLEFFTSGTQSAVIDNSGNIGIGETTPDEKLEIAGRVHLQQTTAPTTTTDKLYNVGGALTWNGQDLTTSSASDNTATSVTSGEGLTIRNAVVYATVEPTSYTNLDQTTKGLSGSAYYNTTWAYENGQSFTTATGGDVNTLTLSLKKTGTPNVVFNIEFFSDEGITSLGVSENLDSSTLTTSFADVVFNYTSTITLSSTTQYWFRMNYVSGTDTDTSNYIGFEYASSDAHSGGTRKRVTQAGVWSNETNDLYFKLNLITAYSAEGYFKGDASDSALINFKGFATSTVATATSVDLATSGVLGGFSGLTAGDYFLTDTAGEISHTAGSTSVKVGEFFSSTELLIESGGEEEDIGSFPKNIYVSDSTAGTNSTVFTFTHNLGLTEANVESGKYKIFLAANAWGAGYQFGDTFGHSSAWGGPSTTSIKVEHTWDSGNPTAVTQVFHQLNDLKIFLGSSGVDMTFKVIIQQMY